jgi:hypothetical protein
MTVLNVLPAVQVPSGMHLAALAIHALLLSSMILLHNDVYVHHQHLTFKTIVAFLVALLRSLIKIPNNVKVAHQIHHFS